MCQSTTVLNKNGRQKGFTLVELITVMVVLGVVSVGIAGFVRTGTQIYVDVVERDQVLSEGRFVVARLNRELRNALPNSLRVSGDSSIQCLEFVPVMFSSFYFDVPVAPEPMSDEVLVVAPSISNTTYTFQEDHHLVVFPTSLSDVYNASTNRRYLLEDASSLDPADSQKLILAIDSPVHFATDSPSSRAYVVDTPISYCVSGGQITRHDNYGYNSIQNTSLGNGVLMAENLQNDLAAGGQDRPFRIAEATLSRNAFVLTLLRFEINDEIVVFNNEVHIPNAP